MQRALGIGGFFFRPRDPQALIDWYRDRLGVDTMAPGGEGGVWQQAAGPTVIAPFPADTDYLGRPDQQYMVNLRPTSTPCSTSFAWPARRWTPKSS